MSYTAAPVRPDANEEGWKDTVRADPGMVTRIIVRFEGYAGRYVWHCHVLEHEDNDMMRPYDVIARKDRTASGSPTIRKAQQGERQYSTLPAISSVALVAFVVEQEQSSSLGLRTGASARYTIACQHPDKVTFLCLLTGCRPSRQASRPGQPTFFRRTAPPMPSRSSIRRNWLNFATLSLRQPEPVLMWPVLAKRYPDG